MEVAGGEGGGGESSTSGGGGVDNDKKNKLKLPTRDNDGLVLLSHVSSGTTAVASSVLQKNISLYGPMNALNCNDALSCWNSEGNRHADKNNNSTTKKKKKITSHSFVVNFGRIVQPVELGIQFQAGFVAENLVVYFKRHTNNNDNNDNDNNNDGNNKPDNDDEWIEMDEFEVDDDHDIQSFPLKQDNNNKSSAVAAAATTTTSAVKLVMTDCTDFFNRVTIYILQVWGKEEEADEAE